MFTMRGTVNGSFKYPVRIDDRAMQKIKEVVDREMAKASYIKTWDELWTEGK